MTLELFHAPLSVASQKVRWVMVEKSLVWSDHLVDLNAGGQFAPDYLRLNPEAVVPTLVHDGQVFVESSLINEYLEDRFPEPALRPADPAERHGMRRWTQFIDTHLHPACGLLTYAIGLRPMMLARPREQVQAQLARIPDPTRRATRASVLEHGVEAPGIPEALRVCVTLLDRMESTLAGRDWLAGTHVSLADASVVPYVLRLEQLALGKLVAPEVRPGVAAWLQRMKSRPAFTRAVDGYLPRAAVDAMQRAGETHAATLDELLRRVSETQRIP